MSRLLIVSFLWRFLCYQPGSRLPQGSVTPFAGGSARRIRLPPDPVSPTPGALTRRLFRLASVKLFQDRAHFMARKLGWQRLARLQHFAHPRAAEESALALVVRAGLVRRHSHALLAVECVIEKDRCNIEFTGLAESDAVEEVCAVVGVSPVGFMADGTDDQPRNRSDEEGAGGAPGGDAPSEALLVLITPTRLAYLRDQMLPTLKRFFREEDRVQPILNARSARDIERMAAFMDLDPHQSLLVEDVVEPVQYRVYPDTPHSEVVDLMVRRELHAVPVVGEDYEFLGVITTGDAMDELLSQARSQSVGGSSATGREDPTAREVMTRTVMCVSEGQSLIEAASIMVNRDVEQLPVIRDGEMVGFLTRGEVLRWLFARP